jgi:hypothetical protein
MQVRSNSKPKQEQAIGPPPPGPSLCFSLRPSHPASKLPHLSLLGQLSDTFGGPCPSNLFSLQFAHLSHSIGTLRLAAVDSAAVFSSTRAKASDASSRGFDRGMIGQERPSNPSRAQNAWLFLSRFSGALVVAIRALTLLAEGERILSLGQQPTCLEATVTCLHRLHHLHCNHRNRTGLLPSVRR